MGEIAALLAAACWAVSSISFTLAGKEVGSMTVNRVRLTFAVILFLITHAIIYGTLIPLDAGWERWVWLSLSGIVGLILGDGFLLQAYVWVGARIGMLVMASVPVISVLLAWLFLGEELTVVTIAGILLTIAGICIVVLEQGKKERARQGLRQYLLGILFSFGGALGQAGGLILAKKGMVGDYSTISAVTIRMIAAFILVWIMSFFLRQIRSTGEILKNKKVALIMVLGSFFGPYIGIWLSFFSVQLTYVGIASALMATTPLFLLPFSKWVSKEHVSRWAVLGTIISIIGVIVLFVFTQ